MRNEEIINKLKQIGYDRNNKEYHIENNVICNENYKDKTLNHSILLNCTIETVVFDNASATGSIFKECQFLKCSIVQTDFEFCNFYNSVFKSKSKIIASFNNSNFINTTFENNNFEFCTFTGVLFENCMFSNVKIKNCTLENAIFKNCTFENMDMSDMNMDYVEVDNPTMKNVVLPLAQIPYMFGCLQYILSTHDKISIASQSKSNISISKYKEDIIPLLVDFWNNNKINEPEYYFPLSNVFIANGNYNNAVLNLRDGLKNAVIQHDFRIIKFYCKLISRSNLFDSSALFNFYNIIKRFGTMNGNVSLPEMQSFIRNIGDIEGALFSSNNNGKLFLRFRTNLSTNDTNEIGIIIGKLFSFSKMKNSIKPNTIEISLTENSPLMISLQVNGSQENIVTLINSFLTIAKLPESQMHSLNIQPLNNLVGESQYTLVTEEANTIINICNQYNVHLFLVEYCIENCNEILPKNARTYCYFNDIDANNWKNHKMLIR